METVVVDGLVCHGATKVLQDVVGVVFMQNEQTQGTLRNTMVSA